jgi:WD40-like Beta Propeller Repeat
MSSLRLRTLLALAPAALMMACGSAPKHNGTDGGAATLSIAPATATLEVINGVAATQDYTATLTAADGSTTDVTDQVSFLIGDTAIGYFDHQTLTAPGTGAGLTQVEASLSGLQATAQVKVLVKGSRVDPSAPGNAPDLFGGAATDPTKVVSVVYPPDQVIVPQNLGDFEVHWTDGSGDDLYEITLHTDYVDLRLYTAAGATGWAAYLPAEWSSAAHNAKNLEVIVRGLSTADPTKAGISPTTTVNLTNDELQGGIYYWAAATSNGAPEGIWRHDMSKPGEPPEQFYTTVESPGNRCTACHVLSRDGTTMAVTYDGGDQSATVLDVASRTEYIPPATYYWNFATFTPDGTKLLVAHQGQLTLRNPTDGALLNTVPNTQLGTHPDFSPNGDQIVYVQRSTGSDWSFTSGVIVTQSYDPATMMFGTLPTPLVSGNGNNYYPSYSPDGKWILFNRAEDNSSAYNSPNAEIWVVKADGSAAPMKLQVADVGAGLTNSWARWAPFASTYGPDDEPLYWITFSSKRDFGVRLVGVGRPQIWMTPFFGDRAEAGDDPTAPAFRLPFQDIGTSNHIAQWTERVVPVN